MTGKRKQATRQSQNTAVVPDVVASAKRTKRHLDELERSNYAAPALFTFEHDSKSVKTREIRDRQTISDKRRPDGPKTKSTTNIRTAVLYRKNLATLVEESNISSLPVVTYLTAVSPPPTVPPRLLCSVCGYRGLYKCRRCAEPYCDLNCQGVHAETRCEKRVV